MKWWWFKHIILWQLLFLLCWDCLNWCPYHHCFFKLLPTFLNSLFSETCFSWLSVLWGFWNMLSGSPLCLFCCSPSFLSDNSWTLLFHGRSHPSCIPLACYKWLILVGYSQIQFSFWLCIKILISSTEFLIRCVLFHQVIHCPLQHPSNDYPMSNGISPSLHASTQAFDACIYLFAFETSPCRS